MAADPVPGLMAAYIVVFLVNLLPALMPPTWSVLAFFLIAYNLPLVPLSVGGAVAASSGRLVLALVSRRWGPRLLSARRQASVQHVGAWLQRRLGLAVPIGVLLYSFGPIPSNQLFISAGLARMDLRPIVASFFGGRLISYTLWAGTARRVVGSLDQVFTRHLSSTTGLALEVAALVLLVLFLRIDWLRLLDGARARSEHAPVPTSGA